MPQTRLARNQRLRGNQLTELVCEVIRVCRKLEPESNSKNLWRRSAHIRD